MPLMYVNQGISMLPAEEGLGALGKFKIKIKKPKIVSQVQKAVIKPIAKVALAPIAAVVAPVAPGVVKKATGDLYSDKELKNIRTVGTAVAATAAVVVGAPYAAAAVQSAATTASAMGAATKASVAATAQKLSTTKVGAFWLRVGGKTMDTAKGVKKTVGGVLQKITKNPDGKIVTEEIPVPENPENPLEAEIAAKADAVTDTQKAGLPTDDANVTMASLGGNKIVMLLVVGLMAGFFMMGKGPPKK